MGFCSVTILPKKWCFPHLLSLFGPQALGPFPRCRPNSIRLFIFAEAALSIWTTLSILGSRLSADRCWINFWASWERILSRTAFVLAIRFAFYSNLFTEMMNSCICCRHYLFWATSFSHWQEVLNPQSNQLDIVDAVSSSCVRIARCISLGRIHVTQLITTGRLGEAPIVLLRSFWASRFADRRFCIFLCWLLG